MRSYHRMFVLGALGAFAVVTAAEAASSRIVFAREGNIYKMKDDGTHETQLTDQSSDSYPGICPGGRIIVFERSGDIWMMDQTGDDETNITPNTSGYNDAQPDCGSDGTNNYVLFASDRHGNNEIYTMRTDGSNVTRLTDTTYDSDQDPTWCGTSKVVFARAEGSGDFDIWTMDVDGDNQAQISSANTVDDRYPACHPGGLKVAFSRLSTYADIVEYSFLYQTEETLTDGWDDGYSLEVLPSYSPGGDYITFSGFTSNTENFDIWTMLADGSSREQLTTDSDNDYFPDWSELAP